MEEDIWLRSLQDVGFSGEEDVLKTPRLMIWLRGTARANGSPARDRGYPRRFDPQIVGELCACGTILGAHLDY